MQKGPHLLYVSTKRRNDRLSAVLQLVPNSLFKLLQKSAQDDSALNGRKDRRAFECLLSCLQHLAVGDQIGNCRGSHARRLGSRGDDGANVTVDLSQQGLGA